MNPPTARERGQSTVEPLIAVTLVVLLPVLAGYVFPEAFGQLVADVAAWIASFVELP